MAKRPAPRAVRTAPSNVVRYMAWSMVIGLVAVPLIFMGLFASRAFYALAFSSHPAVFDRIARPNPEAAETAIANGAPQKALIEQKTRLIKLTGRAEMASGAASTLEFVAIIFTKAKPASSGNPSGENPSGENPSGENLRDALAADADGYRKLTLRIGENDAIAAVMYSDQAIRWSIEGLKPGSWPRLAFEGYASFDIANGLPGSLAGFRIGVFGAARYVRPVEIADGSRSAGRELCSSAVIWARYFGIDLARTRFTLISDPATITVDPGAIQTDGSTVRIIDGAQLAKSCARR